MAWYKFINDRVAIEQNISDKDEVRGFDLKTAKEVCFEGIYLAKYIVDGVSFYAMATGRQIEYGGFIEVANPDELSKFFALKTAKAKTAEIMRFIEKDQENLEVQA